MNQVLAELFGTFDYGMSQEQMAKTAELDLLQKIAEEEGIDLDELSDDQIAEAVQVLEDAGQPEVAEAIADESDMDEGMEEMPEEEKQASAWFELFKEGGEVMAHALVAELRDMQKVAEYQANPLAYALREKLAWKPSWQGTKEVASKAWEGAKGLPGRLSGAVEGRGQKILTRSVERGAEKGKATLTANAYGRLAERFGHENALKMLAAGEAAAIGGGTLAAGGGALAAGRALGRREKTSADRRTVLEHVRKKTEARAAQQAPSDVMPDLKPAGPAVEIPRAATAGPKAKATIRERLADIAKSPRARKAALYGGAGLGTAAALGGLGYLGYRSAEKESSDLVADRAFELLAEAGYVSPDGDLLPPGFDKQAAEIDAAALALIEQAGWPVEWYQ